MKLRFDNYRRPFEQPTLPAQVRRQVDALVRAEGYDLEGAKAVWGVLELVDVVDADSGAVLYQLYLYPHGSGELFADGTTDSLAYVAQHGLETDDLDLYDALRDAFSKADYLEESVYFE